MRIIYIIIKILIVLDLVFIIEYQQFTPFVLIHFLLTLISLFIITKLNGRKQVDGLLIVFLISYFVDPFIVYQETNSYFAVFVAIFSITLVAGFLYAYRFEVDYEDEIDKMKTFYIIIKVFMVLGLFIFEFTEFTPFIVMLILLTITSIVIMINLRGRKQVDALTIVFGTRLFIDPVIAYQENNSYLASVIAIIILLFVIGFLYNYRFEVDDESNDKNYVAN